MLLKGCPWKQLVLRGGSRVCNLLSLVWYPKRVHFASLMLLAKHWGPKRRAPLPKGFITPQKVSHRITHACPMTKDRQS
jgi:hypothetical protein